MLRCVCTQYIYIYTQRTNRVTPCYSVIYSVISGILLGMLSCKLGGTMRIICYHSAYTLDCCPTRGHTLVTPSTLKRNNTCCVSKALGTRSNGACCGPPRSSEHPFRARYPRVGVRGNRRSQCNSSSLPSRIQPDRGWRHTNERRKRRGKRRGCMRHTRGERGEENV